MAIFRPFPHGNHVNQLLVAFVIVMMSLSCPFIFFIYVTDSIEIFIRVTLFFLRHCSPRMSLDFDDDQQSFVCC